MSRPITANTERGRILLALRAGRMATDIIYERFSSGGTYLGELKAAGYVEVCEGFYQLTAAGLRACPSRNPHATVVAPIGRIRTGSKPMSRVIDAGQYDALTKLRGHVYQAISDKDVPEMYRRIGMVQGYLAGLHIAGEIDVGDVQTLEAESLENVYFLLNSRKAH